MFILEDLIHVLNEALDEELFSIDEKIMTKRQARKKKLRAKRRAEKKAAQKAEQQKKAQEQDKQESQDQDKRVKQELIIYDEKSSAAQQPKQFSEQFQKWKQLITQIIAKYGEMLKQADAIWQKTGVDKACPQEAYELYQQAIKGIKTDLEQILQPEYLEGMHEQELEYISTFCTAINGFLEKKAQLIQGLHPEQYVQGEQTQEITGDVTPLLTDNNKQQFVTKTQDKTKVNDLLDYDKWLKSNKKLNDLWKNIEDTQNTVNGMDIAKFIANNNPLTWFGQSVWAFINSPLGTDIVKMFMYINPLTKMLFDGDFGDFGIKKNLDNLKKGIATLKEKAKQANDKSKQKDKNFYNYRGIPKDVSKLNLEDLKREFYGNQMFVNWVNTCYNHPDTDLQDSLDVRNMVKNIKRGFKEEDRQKVIKHFKSLIDKINEIADYNSWNDKESFENAYNEAMKDINRQEKQDKRIAKTKKNNQDNQKQKALSNIKLQINAIKDFNDGQGTQVTKDQIKQHLIDKGFSSALIDQALKDEMGESYFKISKLEKLLEAAEGE